MNNELATNSLSNLAVVLVRPAGSLNIGATARAMMNTGFRELVLVAPVNFQRHEADRMAVSARPLLDEARIVPDLSAAIADSHLVFGVTARARHKRPRLTPAEAAATIVSAASNDQRIALVFGPEDHGLSSDELDACQHLIGIPAHPALTSFNLAQAVLLVCHALYLAFDDGLHDGGAIPVFARQSDRERVEERTLDLLQKIDYLTPNRAEALRDLVKRLVFRTPLETRDVRHLLAILRHIDHRTGG